MPRKTKIGTDTDIYVVHVTRDSDTIFKVKRSKVNLQGAGACCGGLPHSLLSIEYIQTCITYIHNFFRQQGPYEMTPITEKNRKNI